MSSNHLTLAHATWKKHVTKKTCAIDATCGNGHDALFLLKCGISHLYCLDVQPEALMHTEERLQGFKNYSLHLGCHSSFPMAEKPIDLIVYNLGYLPGGNKSLTTQTPTSLRSVEEGLKLLKKNGLMSITLYPGHAEGALEAKALLKAVSHLPRNKFNVCHHRWLRSPRSPILLFITKV